MRSAKFPAKTRAPEGLMIKSIIFHGLVLVEDNIIYVLLVDSMPDWIHTELILSDPMNIFMAH